MTRPDSELSRELLEESRNRRAIARHADQGMAELAMARPANFPSQHVGHQLHAVADAKDWRPEVKNLSLALRGALVGNALWSARQNDACRRLRAQHVDRGVERNHFRVHGQLPQPSGNQLRVLRPKIQNKDGLMGHWMENLVFTLLGSRFSVRVQVRLVLGSRFEERRDEHEHELSRKNAEE
jgi:hypothetical protein